MLTKFSGHPSSSSDDSTSNKRFREYDLHPDLRRLKKQLNAKSPIPAQDSGSADAFLHLSLMKAMHHYSTFDEAGLTDFIQSNSFINRQLEFKKKNNSYLFFFRNYVGEWRFDAA